MRYTNIKTLQVQAFQSTVQDRLDFLDSAGGLYPTESSSWKSEAREANSLEYSELGGFKDVLISQFAKLWKDEEKVMVVKMAIQATKMLADPKVG